MPLVTALQLVQHYIDKCLDRGMPVENIIITLCSRPLPGELTVEALDEDVSDKELYRAAQLLGSQYLVNITRRRLRTADEPLL